MPLQRWLLLIAVVAATGCITAFLLWQRLGSMQEQLARQSAESSAHALEARNTARLAQDTALQTAAKLAVTEARLSEVALQRAQLEALMQSLSRTRDENLVVDIESAIRLAQQQAQLSGSLEPLLAALKSAELRLNRASQPRLHPVQRAVARDLARLSASTMADTPALLLKLDELAAMADDLPLGNTLASPAPSRTLKKKPDETVPLWWERLRTAALQELHALVRVSRIESPEAALLSPEQTFFLRENLKLKFLNARLGLLSRQTDAARADMLAAATLLQKYADPSARKTVAALALLQQVQGQMKLLELPRVDETLAALAAAGAGR
jgi:uroporphyrin-3 C-methyltransferase